MSEEIVGVVPMAGHGTRLGLPFSKELFPVGMDAARQQPLVVSGAVLAQIRRAGATRAFVVLRTGKWDIPAYYQDGPERAGLHLAYLMARSPFGVPFSLDTARPFTSGATVAMGLPNILIHPPDALARVVQRHRSTGADLTLGLFPWTAPPSDDMIDVDEHGRVLSCHSEPDPAPGATTWALMAWGGRFADFMHARGEQWLARGDADGGEFRLSTVLTAAVNAGLVVQGQPFPDGRMLDIGSAQGQARLAEHRITSLEEWAGS